MTFSQRKVSFSNFLFYFLITFILGVFFASYFHFLFLCPLIFFLFYLTLERKDFLVFLLIFPLVFGYFWEKHFEKKEIPKENEIHFYLGKKILFEGEIISHPEIKGKFLEFTLFAKKIFLEKEKRVKGKVLIKTENKFLETKKGDKVLIEGFLKKPQNLGYREYLKSKFIFCIVENPKIRILEKSKKGFSHFLKEKSKNIAKNLGPEEGGLFLGMLFGDKTFLSKKTKESLSKAGIYHIVCVSGLHIICLFEIFLTIFLFLGFWRKSATFLTLIFLWSYIFFVGKISAVRAGIMGTFLYLGLIFGRKTFSLRSLAFSCFLILFFNPLVLKRDLGFQLSFLASFGIVLLKEYFEKISNSLLATTLSAQIFCLPILVLNFSYIPFFSVLTNILVLPFLPYILALSWIYFIISIFWENNPFCFLIKSFFSLVIFVARIFS